MVESSIDDNELGTPVVTRLIVLPRVIRDERRQNRVWRARAIALIPYYEKETKYKKKEKQSREGKRRSNRMLCIVLIHRLKYM